MYPAKTRHFSLLSADGLDGLPAKITASVRDELIDELTLAELELVRQPPNRWQKQNTLCVLADENDTPHSPC
jgi:hypothetical protein